MKRYVLWVVMILLLSLMSGCLGAQSLEKPAVSEELESYKAINLLVERPKGSIKKILSADDSGFYLISEADEQLELASMAEDGAFEDVSGYESSMFKELIDMNSDGNLVEVVVNESDFSGEVKNYLQVTEYDLLGKVKVEHEAIEWKKKIYRDMQVGKNNNIFLMDKDNRITVLDYLGQEITRFDNEDYRTYSIDEGNHIYVISENDSDTQVLKKIDVENNKTIWEKQLNEMDRIQKIFVNESEEKVYLASGEFVYRYSVNDDSLSKIAEYKTQVHFPSLDLFTVDKEENFYLGSSLFDATNFYKFAKGSNDQTEGDISDKKVIRIASLYKSNRLVVAARLLEAEMPDVKIEILMPEGRAEDQFLTLINTEILTGQGPDIFIGNGFPYKDYIEKGILLDIRSEFADSVLFTDQYNEKIMDILEQDNKQYIMPTSYSISRGVMVDKDLYEAYDVLQSGNYDLSQFCDVLEEISEDEGKNKLIQKYTAKSLFNNYFAVNSDLYIDWDSGNARFEEESFVKLLSSIKRIYDLELDEYIKEPKIQSALFSSYNVINGENVFLIDQPTWGNMERYSVRLKPSGINANSINKDVAMKFIEVLQSEDVAQSIGNVSEFSLKKDLDQLAVRLGMGETVKRWNVNYGGSNIDPSIVEQVELFKDQINYYCIEMMDVELLTMINKEVTKFLENKQGPEDAAQAIDRQINLYLKE